jgi:hypothetical protein
VVSTTDNWAVSFAIDPNLEAHIAGPAYASFPAERITLSTVKFDGDVPPLATIALSVRASTPDEARIDATRVFRTIMERLGCPEVEPDVLGVGSPIFEDRVESLVAEALHLVAQGRHEVAVLRAHTAAEIFAKTALGTMFAGRLSEDRRAHGHRMVRLNLNDARSLDVFEALTGSRPDRQAWWDDYRVHLARRHAVAHEGEWVSRDGAMSSIAAARGFIEYLRGIWAGDV